MTKIQEPGSSRAALVWRVDPRRGRAQWHLRVALPDGSRRFIRLDPAIGQDDVERAKACARLVEEELQWGWVSNRIVH